MFMATCKVMAAFENGVGECHVEGACHLIVGAVGETSASCQQAGDCDVVRSDVDAGDAAAVRAGNEAGYTAEAAADIQHTVVGCQPHLADDMRSSGASADMELVDRRQSLGHDPVGAEAGSFKSALDLLREAGQPVVARHRRFKFVRHVCLRHLLRRQARRQPGLDDGDQDAGGRNRQRRRMVPSLVGRMHACI
jgi:hypothetical protein